MNEHLKRIISVICALVFFFAGVKIFNYILVDDHNSYTRIMMHQLHEPEANIDILFLGSSHVYRSLIPSITDEEFDKYTFNAGTSSQFMDGSYALLKEAAKSNDIEKVYLELYFGEAGRQPYSERSEMVSTYIISDYMKPSADRIEYLLNASSNEHWINSFFPARRNWNRFLVRGYVAGILEAKRSESYRNYEYVRGEGDLQYYVDRGFVAYDDVVSEDVRINYDAYAPVGVGVNISKDSDWYDSLCGIVEYCQKRDIEIVFFMAPEPEWTLIGKGDYQEYHDFIADIADGFEVEFYDFNLVRREYFDTDNRLLFKDADHLNTDGAAEFSSLFGKVCTGELNTEDVFYDSFTDKVKDAGEPFYGLASPVFSDHEGYYQFRIISGVEGYEYSVMGMNGEPIREYSEDLLFEIPISDAGIITVSWKAPDGTCGSEIVDIGR